MSDVLHIPGLWSVARRSIPNVIEGKVVPVLLFVIFLRVVGTMGALLVGLGWTAAVIAFRRLRHQRVPGIVVLSAVGLAARTAVALATGSIVVYFLQPTLTTALVGLVFLFSVPLRRPLAERLAHDFVPFTAETAAHPHLRRFFARVSLLWAASSLADAGVTLWLLFTQSTTTFVLIKSVMGPALTASTIAFAVVWFRQWMARHGVRVAFGARAAHAA